MDGICINVMHALKLANPALQNVMLFANYDKDNMRGTILFSLRQVMHILLHWGQLFVQFPASDSVYVMDDAQWSWKEGNKMNAN